MNTRTNSSGRLRDAVLRVLTTHRILMFLEKFPLNEVIFSTHLSIQGETPYGCYDSSTKTIHILCPRHSQTFGKTCHRDPLNLTDNTSEMANEMVESMQRVLMHEMGHHVYAEVVALAPSVCKDVKSEHDRAITTGRYISAYAAFSPKEYFAETFCAYFMCSNHLMTFDPAGHAYMQGFVSKWVRQ